MPVNIRIPFNDLLKSRDSTTNKDAITSNLFFDAVEDGLMAVKRPGLENKTSALGLGINGSLGLGQGIFYYEDTIFSFNSIEPGTTWVGLIQSSQKLVTAAYQNTSSVGDRVLTIDTDDNLFTEELPVLPSSVINQRWRALVYTGTRFILSSVNASNNHSIFWSEDAITWTQVSVPSPNTEEWKVGAVLGNIICLVDRDGLSVLTSTDNGDTWTKTNVDLNWDDPNGRLGVNDTLFTSGQTYSIDGTTWLNCTGTTSESFDDILWTGSFFIILVGTSVFKSPDGINWTIGSLAGTGASIVGTSSAKFTYGNGILVAVSITGQSATSTDGIIWTLGNRNIGLLVRPSEITYFNNAFYLLSKSPTSVSGAPFDISYIEKSIDGINWTQTIIDTALFEETPTLISGVGL